MTRTRTYRAWFLDRLSFIARELTSYKYKFIKSYWIFVIELICLKVLLLFDICDIIPLLTIVLLERPESSGLSFMYKAKTVKTMFLS